VVAERGTPHERRRAGDRPVVARVRRRRHACSGGRAAAHVDASAQCEMGMHYEANSPSPPRTTHNAHPLAQDICGALDLPRKVGLLSRGLATRA